MYYVALLQWLLYRFLSVMMSIGVSRILQWKGSTGGGFRKFPKGVEPRGLGDRSLPWGPEAKPQ